MMGLDSAAHARDASNFGRPDFRFFSGTFSVSLFDSVSMISRDGAVGDLKSERTFGSKAEKNVNALTHQMIKNRITYC